MIQVRQYNEARDLTVVGELLSERDPAPRDIQPKDTLLVAEFDGRILGVLGLRAIPFVHTLEIAKENPLAERIAEALITYGSGYVRASGYAEAMFLVERSNPKMQRFILKRGAIMEGPADLFTLEVK